MDKLDLVIINNDVVYHPILSGDVKWSLERQGSPGKLTFEVVKDEIINFQEGNKVILDVDGKDVFLGYVFEKKRNKSETISVTAYDQLRYYYIYCSNLQSKIRRHNGHRVCYTNRAFRQ